MIKVAKALEKKLGKSVMGKTFFEAGTAVTLFISSASLPHHKDKEP